MTKLPKTKEEIEALKFNLQKFTVSQCAQDYGVTYAALQTHMSRHKITCPTTTERNINIRNHIRQMLSDGYKHEEIRKELLLSTANYASHLARIETKHKTPPGTRVLPFDVTYHKGVLSDRLNFALDQSGYSADQLAFHAGITSATLHNILNTRGKMLNNGNTLLGIAVALNVELDWLLGHTVEKSKSKVATSHPSMQRRPGARHMRKGAK